MKVCPVCQRCYDDAILSCSDENHDFLTEGRAGDCEIIPNYLLDVLHESSAASETYRATNTILKKPYLIKIFVPGAFDEKAKKLFLRETQGLAAIIHPNVARVFESGTLPDGSLYVVTEYFTAQTLRECLENVGKPSEITALTIVRQAAEGLEAIHAAGARHRSVRPENIILTADAENRFLVKLQNIDFGAIRQKQANTAPELFLSDFRYFSPEQCEAKDADAQSDIYSLGVVFYETLAGRVPFNAPYADAIIIKQINETPPEVKINSFDIRMLLTHTLTDALQKQTRTRLKSANALARQLRHIEQLATHSSTPPPAMSYPAEMNKPSVSFAPPAKIEMPPPVKIKTVVEDLPLVEKETVFGEETPIIFEPETVVENEPVAEEIPVVFEAEAAVENEPVVEESLPVIESQTAAGDLILAENEPVVEEKPAAINVEPPIVEIPKKTKPRAKRVSKKHRKNSTHARNANKNSPALEAKTVVETPVEAQMIIENPVETENRIVFEPLVETQAASAENPAETQTVIEETTAVETQAPVEENPPVIETQTAIKELTPIEAELPAIVETPVEIRVSSEEPKSPAPVFVDLTTNKLPPLESVVKKPLPENIKITEITPIFSLKSGFSDIHKTSEPVLIDWEQPDDVPTITQALREEQKEAADAAFAVEADFIDDEDDVIDAGDADAPTVVRGYEYRRPYDEEQSLFAYPDSGWAAWNLPEKRKVLTGVGLVAFLVLIVGGTFLNRQIQSARTADQTTAKSSPNGKTLPKTADAEKVSQTEKSPAAKPENAVVNNQSSDQTDELPGYNPRETETKTNSPETRNKKTAPKETSEKREPVTQTKLAVKETADKKAETKSPDKKTAVKNQPSTPTKTDGLTRPRIVKTQ